MKALLTLKKNHEFQRLYRRGTSAVGGCLVIYCRKNRLRRNRIGLTASTKLGNAVKRNRARRRMREAYRLNADKLRPGWDLILVARTRTLYAPWTELNATFLRLCKKLGLLQDAPETSGKPEARRRSAAPDLRRRPDALNASESLQSAAPQPSEKETNP
ncbi:MAG: ribonuclease P protein component [Oscillospiraceae bacterium]|nr:ribonuclease P protein component [Oscillospiraceae bacterium]